jgi:hypothetical protein
MSHEASFLLGVVFGLFIAALIVFIVAKVTDNW